MNLLCSESTTPDMVDEYDCELMNEVYHYSRSSGVVSTEDEIAARRVEMTANPAYGTATSSKFALSQRNHHNIIIFSRLDSFPISESTSPDVVDENDYEFPELNKQKTCDNPSQLKDPELIDTYDSVYDSASIEPNKEVVYYDCPTGVGSGEDDLEARKVEFTILEDWISK